MWCSLFTSEPEVYAANLLKADAITSVGSNIHQDRESQLDDENLGVGSDTWVSIADEHDTKPFFTAIRNFYIAKMLLKFPFSDSLLKDLGILQPEKTASYSVETVLSIFHS